MSLVSAQFSGVGVIPSSSEEKGRAIFELTQRLKILEETAWREFFEQYHDRLFRYHLGYFRGDEDSARDAVQQTFRRTVKYIKPFRSEADFWNWLRSLARSAALDTLRSEHRYQALLKRYASELPPPERCSVNYTSLLSTLQLCLRQLGENDRLILSAHYFEHKTCRQLALEKQCTEKAIESRLFRARKKLKKHLIKELERETDA